MAFNNDRAATRQTAEQAAQDGEWRLALEEIRFALTDNLANKGVSALPTDVLKFGTAIAAHLEDWEAFYELSQILRTSCDASGGVMEQVAFEIGLLLDCGALMRAARLIEDMTLNAPRALVSPESAEDWALSEPLLGAVPLRSATLYLIAIARYAVYLGVCRSAVTLTSICMGLAEQLEGRTLSRISYLAALAEAEAFMTFGDIDNARAAATRAARHSRDDWAEERRLARIHLDISRLSGHVDVVEETTKSALLEQSVNKSPLMGDAALDLAETLIALNQVSQVSELLQSVAKNFGAGMPQRTRERLRGLLGTALKAETRSTRQINVSAAPRPVSVFVERPAIPFQTLGETSARAGAMLGLRQLRHALAERDGNAINSMWRELSRVLMQTDSPLLLAYKAYAAALVERFTGSPIVALEFARSAEQLLPEAVAPMTRWQMLTLCGQLELAEECGDPVATFRAAEKYLWTVAGRIREIPARRVFLADKTASAIGLLEAEIALYTEQGDKTLQVPDLASIAVTAGNLRRLGHIPAESGDLTVVTCPDANTAVLRIVLAGSRGLVALETNKGIRAFPTLEPPASIRVRVDHFNSVCNEVAHRISTDSKADDVFREKAKLERLLTELAFALGLEKVMHEIPGNIGNLAVVADDVLSAFPHAALPVFGVPLIDRFDVASVREMPNLPERPEGTGAHVFAFSEASVLTNGTLLPSLPAAMIDQREISKLLDAKINTATAARARRRGIKTALERARQIHIACHGLFVPEQPSGSGLVIPDSKMPSQAEVLSLSDLMELEGCIAARHVTLSACLAAGCTLMEGGRAVSLATTLVDAGVQLVAGFLWPVRDQFSTQAFSLYHRNCKDNSPLRAASEQARAIRKLAKDQAPAYLLPIYWANLHLVAKDIGVLARPQ